MQSENQGKGKMNNFVSNGETVYAAVEFDKVKSGKLYGFDMKDRAIIIVGLVPIKVKGGVAYMPDFLHVPRSLIFDNRRDAHVLSLTAFGEFPIALKVGDKVQLGKSNRAAPEYKQRPDGLQKSLLIEFDGDWIDGKEFLVSNFEVAMRAKGIKTDTATLSYRTFEYGSKESLQVNGFRFEGDIEFDYFLN